MSASPTPAWIRYALMPLTIGLGVLACALLDAAGAPRVLALVATTLAVAILLGVLERVYPMRADWRQGDGQTAHDVGHAIVGSVLGLHWGEVAAAFLVASLAGEARGPGPTQELPLVAEIAVVFLVADLGRWLQHRALHKVPWLWRIHQVHHSADVLNVFKTGRNHALERFTQQLAMYVPLLLLGPSVQSLYYFGAINGFMGFFAHANLDCRIGPLELVLSGPGCHRLHHSRALAESCTNLGTALVVWDRLFGTYTNPHVRFAPDAPRFDVGIEADDHPRSFLRQLAWPFTRRLTPAKDPTPCASVTSPPPSP